MCSREGKVVGLYPHWDLCYWPTFRMEEYTRCDDSQFRIGPVRNMELCFFRSEGRGRISVVESHVEIRCFDPRQRRLPLKAFDFMNWELKIIIWESPENRIRESSVLVTEMFFFLFDISCCSILAGMLEDVCLRSRRLFEKGVVLATHGYSEVKGSWETRLNPSSAIQRRASWDACIRILSVIS